MPNTTKQKILVQFLISLLGIVDVFPTLATGKKDLKRLIQKLRPIATGKPLLRLGPRGDGGYLVPDDICGVEACFSPGVGLNSGFEKDCANRGMKVFLADGSVTMPPAQHDNFNFMNKHIGVTSSDVFMTIDDWINISLPASTADLMLQIDVEGCEYEIFLNMSDNLLRRFRIIVAEFHGLHKLGSQPFYALASRAFEKVLQHHVCVHIHPNNLSHPLKIKQFLIPPLAEFTFLRRDRVSNPTPAEIFPHPLDCDNTGSRSFALPCCWYRQ